MKKTYLLGMLAALLSAVFFIPSVYAHDCIDGLDNDGDGLVDEADDLCAGSWETLSHMPIATQSAAAAALGEEIYVIGGRTTDFPQNNVSTVQVYNTSSDSWSFGTSINEGRGVSVAETVGNMIYVIGGLYNTSNNAIFDVKSSVEIYNPQTQQWSFGSAKPTARWGSGSTVFGGEIYVGGGAGTIGIDASSDFEKYNPVTDSWQILPSLPIPKHIPGLGTLDGKIYVIGGQGANGEQYSTVEVFDPSTDTWSQASNLPKAMVSPGVAVVDNTLFVFGGYNRESAIGVFQNFVYEYDKENDGWVEKSPLSFATSIFASATVSGKIYKFGGATNNGQTIYHDEVEVFTPSFTEGESVEPPQKSYEDLVAELQEKVETEVEKKSLLQSYFAHIKNLIPFYESLNLKAARNQIGALVNKFSNEAGQNELAEPLQSELIDLGTQIDEVLADTEGSSSNVPLMTQIASPYPPESVDWANDTYADGLDPDCLTIADCGCAISSLAMLGQYYGISQTFDGTNINPGNLNAWLAANNGYTPMQTVRWHYALQYLSPKLGYSQIQLDTSNETSYTKIAKYVAGGNPAIGYKEINGHWLVLNGVIDGGFEVRDPYWYLTQTTNDTKDVDNHVQGYGGGVDRANLFSFSKGLRPFPKWVEIQLGSPAELLLTDSQGRRTGYDPQTGNILNEIPDSSYVQSEGTLSKDIVNPGAHLPKVLMINKPTDDLYELKVIGTGTGDYDLTVDTNGGYSSIEFEHIPGTTTMGEVDTFIIDVPERDSSARAVERLNELADQKEAEQPTVAANLREIADRLETKNVANAEVSVSGFLTP